ncbi:SDR family oxidoreductase [Pseudomonas sp. N40(2020)]|uniref:SDR family oxidoreductase n=1 Tax=Pseudomonas sp. N40(2020) TaxID=2767798 RepID=UPI001657634E|nr:SDR family oxidoreductase [Pseudomonas sp. N40(2020)]MBC8998634.1 SDR family oxidoreductase [Pseudomonas sp. N40(2020)]
MKFGEGTISVVIGGSSGIGRALALSLETRPGRVIVASRSSGLDVGDIASVERFFTDIGLVDHVIFTAGSSAPGGPLVNLDFDTAKTAFDVKFWGALAVAKAAAPHIKPGGTITFTSGFLARKTVPGTLIKTAMNAAIEAVAKILAVELAPVRVNVISPGLTDTEAYQGMEPVARKSMLDQAAATLPARRFGRAEDIAQGFLFVIENPFVTGATIDIDGGALVR